ncbi:MAG TPA: hypothetical protein PK323_05845, partial [Bacteroidia bacterium]|nr:hypothetical protein [Bacteroidia bacterium]
MKFIYQQLFTLQLKSLHKLVLLMVLVLNQSYLLVNAQTNDKWVLEIGGRVLDDSNGQEMEEVLIVLYKDKTEINKVRTTAAGTFLFKVPQDDEFTLVFSKNGYTSKKLSINTKNVPKELSDKTAVFNYRGAKVYLFEVVPDLDVTILEQPIGKIYFDPAQKNFDYDKEYTKSIKSKVEVLSKALEVKKQKEAAESALKAKQNAEFNKLIAEGDASLANKKFDDAVFTYTKALNMNIDKSTCNAKIKAAKEAKEADELAKKQAEFDKFINDGNTLLAAKKFDDAVNQYNKAFLMNFDNQKATERTENAKYQKKKDEFDKYIADGDAQVALKKYDEAIKEYNKGLAMNFENNTAENKIKAAQNFKSDVLLAKKKAEFDAYITAGDAKLTEKKFDDAVKEYNKALAMNFENASAETKIKSAQTAKSKDTFDKIIAEGD